MGEITIKIIKMKNQRNNLMIRRKIAETSLIFSFFSPARGIS